MKHLIQELISLIPSLEPVEFNQLTGVVFAYMCSQNLMHPLSMEQWAEKLDHSLAQARDGEKSDASTLTTRIRRMEF